MATAADRRRGGNVAYTDGGDSTTCPETPFQDADVGRYRRLLSLRSSSGVTASLGCFSGLRVAALPPSLQAQRIPD